MNWFLYLFGGGGAFFLGIGLVLTGVVLASLRARSRFSRTGPLAAAIGIILIAFSATPLPY